MRYRITQNEDGALLDEQTVYSKLEEQKFPKLDAVLSTLDKLTQLFLWRERQEDEAEATRAKDETVQLQLHLAAEQKLLETAEAAGDSAAAQASRRRVQEIELTVSTTAARAEIAEARLALQVTSKQMKKIPLSACSTSPAHSTLNSTYHCRSPCHSLGLAPVLRPSPRTASRPSPGHLRVELPSAARAVREAGSKD